MKPASYRVGVGLFCGFCANVQHIWGKSSATRRASGLLNCSKHGCRVAWNGGCVDWGKKAKEPRRNEKHCAELLIICIPVDAPRGIPDGIGVHCAATGGRKGEARSERQRAVDNHATGVQTSGIVLRCPFPCH